MRIKRAIFRVEDLTLATQPVHRWICPGCYRKLTLKPGDTRAHAALAPKCVLCGDFMCPIAVEAKERPN